MSQDLELLPDFGFYIVVLRVPGGQFRDEIRIELLKGEFASSGLLLQSADAAKNLCSPTTSSAPVRAKKLELLPVGPDIALGSDAVTVHD